MQEGEVVKTFRAGGVDTIFRYPRQDDLDAFIEMHLTLTREKVMCRRLTLDRESGRRMLAAILDGLKQDNGTYNSWQCKCNTCNT